MWDYLKRILNPGNVDWVVLLQKAGKHALTTAAPLALAAIPGLGLPILAKIAIGGAAGAVINHLQENTTKDAAP